MILLRFTWTQLLLAQTVLCVSDLSGKEFVLSFPTPHTVYRRIYFLIYTMEINIDVTVNLTRTFGSGELLEENLRMEENVTVNREEIGRIYIKENFTNLRPDEAEIKFGKGKYQYILPKWDISKKFSYLLTSPYKFFVTVLIIYLGKRGQSFATLQAVPVAGWGNVYYAVTLAFEPSIQVMTAVENTVSITIKSPKKMFAVMHDELLHLDAGFMTLTLEAYRSFSLQACPKLELTDYGELTGTRVEGEKPLGVVSGNCEGYIEHKCSLSAAVTKFQLKTDLTMEMLLPEETYGSLFVLFNVPGRADDSSTHIIVASSANTTVRRQYALDSSQDIIEEKGGSIKLPGRSQVQLMTTTHPVAVYLVYNTKCDIEYGDASIMTLIPNALFMDVYLWRTMNTSTTWVNITHYLQYVCNSLDVGQGLLLDGKELEEYRRYDKHADIWEVGVIIIEPGYHEMFSTRSAKFAVYITGIGEETSYMYPAGFISSPINDTSKCVRTPTDIYGDLIDNDCDGLVDEELRNRIDDDKDDELDEDIMPDPPRNGSWSEWTPWTCTGCSSTTQFRTRSCENPAPVRGGHYCAGLGKQDKLEVCSTVCSTNEDEGGGKTDMGTMTRQPKDESGGVTDEDTKSHPRIDGSWGNWLQWICSKECSISTRMRKCDSPAPKNGGLVCVGPDHQNQKSLDCMENCKPTTSMDTLNYWYLLSLLLLLPIAILCYLWYIRTKNEMDNNVNDVHKVNSKMSPDKMSIKSSKSYFADDESKSDSV